MVIIGGSGNNLGAVLGGFIIWFLWVQVEPIGQFLMVILTSGLADDNTLKLHLMDSVAHMRLLTMGLLLLLVLRFSPRANSRKVILNSRVRLTLKAVQDTLQCDYFWTLRLFLVIRKQ